MPKEIKESNIINCHTHIFTIDHVPNKFGKKFLPWPLYHIITIKLIKWYYENLTERGSRKYRRFKHSLRKIKFGFFAALKYTFVLWWVFAMVSMVIKWVVKIILNFLQLEKIVSPEFRQLYYRYLTLARYSAKYKSQAKILDYLAINYPPKTKYVILSMDMDYMGAGRAVKSYTEQLKELQLLRNKRQEILPFLSADPRRIRETNMLKGKKSYINLAKSLLNKKHFFGIKLYPALGYYPFDKELIDLWEFAQLNEVPVMVHCIKKGSVFYRGKKEKKWREHEILRYNKKEGIQTPIRLPQKKNYDFTSNFTHPLNYECLLNSELLSTYLGEEKDLSKLKICLGHFGGSEEWENYKADAWNYYNNNISPLSKQDYYRRKQKNTLNHGSKRTIWWNASWLSIIYDLMVKYEHVYADISFIIYNETLFPMLKYLLQDEKVKNKILFGTDYYVVSQKGLDKDLYLQLRSYLGEELFEMIALENPRLYLKTKFS